MSSSAEDDDIARAIAMSMGMPPPPANDPPELGSLLEMGFTAAVVLIGICGCWYACAGSGEEPERESSPDVELNDVYKQPKKTTREVV